MTSPFFSIIIPIYNVVPYLCECLNSILAQTYKNWEAICIDDGSKDGSGEIVDEYAAKDNRFRVIHQKNTGVGAARNAGLNIVSGEWVLFLDGDDVWHPELLSIVVSMIARYPNEKLIRFGFENFEGNWCYDDIFKEKINNKVIDITQEILMSDFYSFLFFCYVYHKDLFDGITFPRYKRGEDRCVLNRIMLEKADCIVAVDLPLYGYRSRSGSAMNSVPSRQVLCDEMDHRLDIMEMIDASNKTVAYAGNFWLEKYFTIKFYHIINSRKEDKSDILFDWRKRLHRLRRMKGISKYGHFVAWSCSLIHIHAYDALMCYVIPRFCNGGSLIRWIVRKVRKRPQRGRL